MIDVVYILGTGSTWQDNEIRYSIRSVEKHLKNYRNIFIVGTVPDFLYTLGRDGTSLLCAPQGKIIWIPEMDISDNPAINIREKILTACEEPRISDDFLCMQDDLFFTSDVDAPTYPNYHQGPIRHLPNLLHSNWYQVFLKETEEHLKQLGLSTVNYDVHTPIIYNKRLFQDAVKKYFPYNKKLIVKSIYGNAYQLPGEFIKDLKIFGYHRPAHIDAIVNESHIFSTGDWCMKSGYIQQKLQELYPTKSSYEL